MALIQLKLLTVLETGPNYTSMITEASYEMIRILSYML